MLSERSELMYKIKYMPDDENALLKSFLISLSKDGNHQIGKSVLLYIDRLREHGFDINKDFKSQSLKKIKEKLWELRPKSARILLTYHAKEQAFYILNCFIKKTNKTPEEEKNKARILIEQIK